MKFVCDRCQTRYTIADEKIRRRIVRIRCKNCGGVVTLHGGEKIAGPQDAAGRLSSDLPAGQVAGARGSSKVSRSPTARTEWFVAVDGVEKGPLSCTEAAKYITSIGADHVVHVWKEGMDEWKRPKDVAIISQELSALKRSPDKGPVPDKAPDNAWDTAPSEATVVTPAPVAFDAPAKPAPSAVGGSGPKLPGVSARGSAQGSVTPSPVARAGAKVAAAMPGSSPKTAPAASGSGPKRAAPAVTGSAPKAAPPPVTGTGLRSGPPPIPATHRAPPPIPASVSKTTPPPPARALSDSRPAAKSSTYPVVKTPAPVTVPRPTPAAAASVVPDGRPAAKSSTYPVVKTPAPVTVPRVEPVAKTPAPVTVPRPTPPAAASAVPEARPTFKSATYPVVKTPAPVTAPLPKAEAKPEHESTPIVAEPTPGTESEFDEVPTSPASRYPKPRAAAGTETITPVIENTPGVQDFSEAEKTPPPSQPLPPMGVAGQPVRESKNWPVVANLTFAHPPALSDGMSADGAMALPTPAPLAGPLFANVADMPVKSLVGHAEMGLSKLTGLAGLVNKHQHLKYVAAAGLLLVLVISVILLSWRGDSGKTVNHVAEIERKARAAALAADPIPLPPGDPSLAALVHEPEREPSKAHIVAAAHANKKASPKPTTPSSPSGKAAPAENPLEPPPGMMRSTEKPIPLAALQGKRATPSNEPRPIPQSQIADVIRKKENQAGLKTCYERALKRDGRLRTGRLDITVSIGPMGSVQRVQVHGSADFMIIESCLKEAIRHWRFPGNSEEYATSFPLILQGG